jgi:PAS domain S-box-containing protein
MNRPRQQGTPSLKNGPVGRKSRVFIQEPGATAASRLPSAGIRSAATRAPLLEEAEPSRKPLPELTAQREADRLLLRRFTPPAVLVNGEFQVLEFRGSTGAYLEPPAGKASFDILKMAREGLMLPMRAALNEAKKKNENVRKGNLKVTSNGGTRTVNLEVMPLRNLKERCYLVLFEETGLARRAGMAGEGPAKKETADKRGARPATTGAHLQISRLQEELAETRDYVQSLRERYEAAHEELQASNEEVTSSNEELQSLNEELETSKEELESANEELATINEELAARHTELKRLHALDQERADQELRESEARLSLVADAAAVGLWQLDLVNDCFWLTNKTRELYGFAQDERVTFERVLTLVHPDDQQLLRQTMERLVRSKSEGPIEYRIVRPDGGLRYMFSRGRVHCNAAGEPDYLMGVSLDVSERSESDQEAQRNRAEIAHLSRAAMLGELSGSLAHELNQPLTAILSNAEAALGFLADGNANLEEVREILKDIVIDGERAGEVIRRLRLLLKKGEVHHLPLDLDEVTQDVLKMVRHDLLNHGITLETEFAPDLAAVSGDRVQLQQVLLNLILNAADAMANTVPADRHLTVRTEPTREGGIRVSVGDRGTGLAPEVRARIFEPFFTTKSRGMGLGLKVCRTIITAHGGQIRGNNNPEQGSTFYFELPAARKNSP